MTDEIKPVTPTPAPTTTTPAPTMEDSKHTTDTKPVDEAAK
jgi:hypothetical protein